MKEEDRRKKRRRVPQIVYALIIACALLTAVSTIAQATNRPLRYYAGDGGTAMTFYANSSGDQNKSLWGINTDNPVCELDINGTVCIDRTGIFYNGVNISGSAGAPSTAQYVTLALDGSLSAERVLTPGKGITVTDTGANGIARINITGLKDCTGTQASQYNGTEWNCVSASSGDNNYTTSTSFEYSGNNVILQTARNGANNVTAFFTFQSSTGILLNNGVFYANATNCSSGQYSRYDGNGWGCFNDASGSFTYSTYFNQVLNTTSNVEFGNITPAANNTYDLGSPTRYWRDLYVSNGTIHLGPSINITGNITDVIVNGVALMYVNDQRYNSTTVIGLLYSNITALQAFRDAVYANVTTLQGLVLQLGQNDTNLNASINAVNTRVTTTNNTLQLALVNITDLKNSNTSTNNRIDDLNSSKVGTGDCTTPGQFGYQFFDTNINCDYVNFSYITSVPTYLLNYYSNITLLQAFRDAVYINVTGKGTVNQTNGTAGYPAVFSAANNLVASLIGTNMITLNAINSSLLNTTNTGTSGQVLTLNTNLNQFTWATVTSSAGGMADFGIAVDGTNTTIENSSTFNIYCGSGLTCNTTTTSPTPGVTVSASAGGGNASITTNGTFGYLPRITGLGTMNTSNVYDNGSAVGIGTNDLLEPAMLTVAGIANFTNDLTVGGTVYAIGLNISGPTSHAGIDYFNSDVCIKSDCRTAWPNYTVTSKPEISWFTPISAEFLSATSTTSYAPMGGLAISSGTQTTNSIAGEVNHPGVIALTDSTTANGGYLIGTASEQIQLNGTENSTWIFKLPGTKTGQTLVASGFLDSVTTTHAIVDGCFFLDNTTGSGATSAYTIMGRCRTNSVETNTSTNYTATNNTWYTRNIYINNSVATFTITNGSGSVLFSENISTNVPLTRTTGFAILAFENSTNAATNIVLLDYASLTIGRYLRRY